MPRVLPGCGIPQIRIHTSDDQSPWAFQHCHEENNVDRQNGYVFFCSLFLFYK